MDCREQLVDALNEVEETCHQEEISKSYRSSLQGTSNGAQQTLNRIGSICLKLYVTLLLLYYRIMRIDNFYC